MPRRLPSGRRRRKQVNYERTLRQALRHRLATVGVAGLMAVLTVVVARMLPLDFIPTDDTGQIQVSTEAAQDVSFAEMMRHQQTAATMVARHPAVAGFMSSIGGGGPTSTSGNTGRMFISLKPRQARAPAAGVVQDLRRQLAGIPGLRVYPQLSPPRFASAAG